MIENQLLYLNLFDLEVILLNSLKKKQNSRSPDILIAIGFKIIELVKCMRKKNF